MLIQLSVENFRSIAKRQVIDFYVPAAVLWLDFDIGFLQSGDLYGK